MKYSDIVLAKDGNYLIVPDIKGNMKSGRKNPVQWVSQYHAVSRQLIEYLRLNNKMQFVGTERYLIAPQIEAIERNKLKDVLSKSFAHFLGQTGIKKKLSFHSLRKPYMNATKMLAIKNNFSFVTGQSNDDVANKYYIDKVAIVKKFSLTFEGVISSNS